MSFNFPSLSNNMNMHLLNSHNSVLPKLLQQQVNKNNIQHQLLTSVNNDAVNDTSMNMNCDHHESCDNGTPSSDLVFNSLMGLQPQMLMLPSVMIQDANSLQLSLQQFPLLNLPSATVTSSNSNNNDTQKLSEHQHSKELIQCKSCVLIPPNPNHPAPTTRERPLGCRTCFVGGLPENITEEIIQEIFERCGEITTLRLSKKNFCHIRFAFEASVDSAIYLSGYRVKINNSNEPGNTGKLHVDFAQARDDQYEYECKQRQFQREQRHKEKAVRSSSTSPPMIAHYTDHEAGVVAEKLKNDETFTKSIQTLIAWLDKGDCNKKNSNIFYSMIQSTNSHTRRLLNEKNQYDEEVKEAKDKYQRQMVKMMDQFNQIEKVFKSASHKKVWDHFTKAQRKNIDQWCKQISKVKSAQEFEEFDYNVDDIEMEMSDDDEYKDLPKKSRIEKPKRNDDLIHDKNSDLRDETSDQELKEKQIKVFQETIRNLQRKLLETTTKEKQHETKINELEEAIRESNVKELLLRTKIANKRSNSLTAGTDDLASETSSVSPNFDTSHEPAIISLTTAFLVIHPKGATFESIYSYVQQYLQTITGNDLYDVLNKHEKLFYTSNVKSETKDDQMWSFKGFQMP